MSGEAQEEAAEDRVAQTLTEIMLPPETALPQQPAWTEGLSFSARAFVSEFLSNGLRAGPAAKAIGLSEGSGARLRRDPRIMAAIEKALAESGLTRLKVLEQISAIVTAELRDVADWKDGKLVFRDAADIPDGAHAAITGMKLDPETGRIERIQMDGKMQMLALLAKALKVVGPDAIVGVQNTVQVILSPEDRQVL